MIKELKMKLIRSLLFVGLAILLMCGFMSYQSVQAAENLQPSAKDNLSVRTIKKSKLIATKNGYMRLFVDSDKICIEHYDGDFNIISKKSIKMELDFYGGFYEGKDAYYLVEGKNNTDENDSAEVIRVIKYDKNWKRLGAAKITGNTNLFGGEVRYPFDYGCVEMTEHDGVLYIVTGHEGYVDPAYNQGHQGFLMMAVDEKSMTGKIISSDLWHSFAQYIETDGSNLYVLEESEGSRYTKLSKYALGITENSKLKSIPVLEYGGDRTSAWAIATYATVDDMALSSSTILGLGSSIDQSKYDDYTSDTSYNIYLTVTPKSDFSKEKTKLKWITSYKNNGKRFPWTYLTKINDNRYMISWKEKDEKTEMTGVDVLSDNILHYIFVDKNGEKVSKEYKVSAPISDCKPILNGSDVVYYASSENAVNFYKINSSTGKFTKKTYKISGPNAGWDFKDDTLVISGSGAITGTGYGSISDKAKKIVIEKGITSIPKNAFSYFSNLEEVIINDGVKSIGEQAFSHCENLRKIYIPKSVDSIGEDVVWTGSFWLSDYSHVTYATIYASENSYAIQYAKDNRIAYNIAPSGIKVDKTSITINKGKTAQIKATVSPNSATDKSVKWTSSDEKVVKVDANGKLTAIKGGKATITASTANGIKSTTKVTVNFIDVNNTKDWYYNATYWATNKGIVNGTNGYFYPANSCTREQAITMLWRLAGSPAPKSMTSKFSDVKNKSSYSYKAIMWGNEQGLIFGSKGKFNPKGTCTREQIVTMLWRWAGKPEPKTTTSKFKDVKNKKSYSYKAILWANEKGIAKGSNGKFSPTVKCKRRDIVTFIYRYKN